MALSVYKLIGALLIFLSSAAVIYPLKRKHIFKHAGFIELGEAFASGIFLGAAFFHMLPEAIQAFHASYATTLPIPEIVCLTSFILFLFLEKLSLLRRFSSKKSIPYVVTLILIIHALVEGAALGVGATITETFMLLIAILAHKGSESFALCIILLRHQLPMRRLITILLIFSSMTPLGILLGSNLDLLSFHTSQEMLTAYFNAFAAGTFLYISTLHHIQFHQSTEENQGLGGLACFTAGLTAMGLLAFWV